MIVPGGENVYLIEVEKTLVAHRQVAEAAVIGTHDDRYGQRLAAFVVLEPASSATVETLTQHARDNLANYKVPRLLSILGELARGRLVHTCRTGAQFRRLVADKIYSRRRGCRTRASTEG